MNNQDLNLTDFYNIELVNDADSREQCTSEAIMSSPAW